MRYFPVLVAVGAAFAVWQHVSHRPIERAPGLLVDSEPQQRLIAGAQPIEFKGIRLTPRAEFKADVRVLARERYRLGKLGDVAPLDLAVGWREMSDSVVLGDIDISQSGRFYFWSYEGEPPISESLIVRQSANWHLIPANPLAWRVLKDVRVGDVVTLEGRLVDIDAGADGIMKTSLTRDDAGAGACEILFVEEAELAPRRGTRGSNSSTASAR
jgi:hypothetical protein